MMSWFDFSTVGMLMRWVVFTMVVIFVGAVVYYRAMYLLKRWYYKRARRTLKETIALMDKEIDGITWD